MRWVKTVITIVIVLAIIPTIVLSINKLTSGYTKRVEYEITITKENVNETVYELYNLVKLDKNNDEINNVTNWLYVEKDGENISNIIDMFYYTKVYDNRIAIKYLRGTSSYWIDLYLDNPSGSEGFDNYIKIILYDEISVEPPLTPTESILISLIPLILVSGLLIYQYKELGLNKNE